MLILIKKIQPWPRLMGVLLFAMAFSLTACTQSTQSRSGQEILKDSRVEAEEYIKYFHSIQLTKDQEKIKLDALTQIAAPCCKEFSMATCCCECNLAKSVWGLSHYLIVKKDYKTAELKSAVEDWIAKINPDGFSGNACFNGGCKRSFDHDGCGGMTEKKVI